MTTTPTPEKRPGPAERMLAALRPARVRKDGTPILPKGTYDDLEILDMMWRWVRNLEARTIERPENLAQVLNLVERFNEIVNVTIAVNAAEFEVNPARGMSAAECGRVLGVSKQAASKRRQIGERIVALRLAKAGATSLSERRRERDAIMAAAAHAIERLVDPAEEVRPEVETRAAAAVVSLERYKAKHRAA